MEQRPSELNALTSLRGIAAILVMCHHFMFVLMPETGFLIPSKFLIKSYLWVDLFFILSGFVLAYVYHDAFRIDLNGGSYQRFLQTRFARIYPLHFFCLMFFVAFEGIQLVLSAFGADGMDNLPVPFTGDESAETILTNLLLVQTLHWEAYWNQPAWSISAEWLTYLTLPFLIRWLLPRANGYFGAIFVVAFTPLILIEWYFGDLGLYYAGWPMLFRCIGEATLGILAFRCYQTGAFSDIANPSYLMPVFVLNLALLALPIPGVISVAGFAWLVLCAARLPGQKNHVLNHSILVYLGTVSYSIYLVHWFFLDILRDSVAFLTGKSVSEAFSLPLQFAILAALVVIVVAVSHVTYHRIETPLRARLRPEGKVKRATP